MRKLRRTASVFPALLVVALTLATAPAQASGPAVHQPQTLVFESFNPCTGNDVLVTFAEETAVFHATVDATGNVHTAFAAQGTTSTSDGFSGHFAVRITGGGFNQNSTLRDGSGQVINVHVQGHLAEEGLVFDRIILECVGKPS